MKHTNRQTTRRTLTDLYRAIDRRQAVTITYLDETGEETIRTIEPWRFRTTDDGRIQLIAGCRLRGEARSFFPDAIVTYTLHRIAFVMEEPESDTPAPTHRTVAAFVAYELERKTITAVYRQRAKRLAQTDTGLAA